MLFMIMYGGSLSPHYGQLLLLGSRMRMEHAKRAAMKAPSSLILG